MKRTISAIAGFAALASASAVAAQEGVIKNTTGRWVVHENASQARCSMVTLFEDGTSIHAEMYMRFQPQFTLSFRNQNWQSLTYTGATFQTRLVFSGPENLPAVAAEFGGANRDYGPVFTLSLDPNDMTTVLSPMARSNSMRVETEGKVIGTYSMAGSRDATLRFSACIQGYIDRLNSDPFRK